MADLTFYIMISIFNPVMHMYTIPEDMLAWYVYRGMRKEYNA